MDFSCGVLTERAWEGTIGKRAVAAIVWARMPYITGWLVGASCEAVLVAYIIPFTPSSACIFLSPRFTARHTRMNMEAVKGFLAPLGLNTSSIQDTLVCILCSFPTLGQGLQLYFAETGCHWWHSRDCPKSLDIRMEWICGLFVLYFSLRRYGWLKRDC